MRPAIMLLWACLAIAGDKDHPPPQSDGVRPRPRPVLELLPGWKFVQGPYSGYITGSIRNNSARQYKYVQISFKLYDGTGVQVGSTSTNLSDFEGHGVWKFKAVVFEREARTCRVKDLSGF